MHNAVLSLKKAKSWSCSPRGLHEVQQFAVEYHGESWLIGYILHSSREVISASVLPTKCAITRVAPP